MSRYIDADNLSKAKYHDLPYTHIVPNGENVESYERGWNDAIDAIIENEPSADVVEVVRCKDCLHYWDGRTQCDVHDGVNYNPDDYCSYAERKTK